MKGNNSQRAFFIIDELVRCGIDQFVVAPGFRSAPLALAAVSHDSAHVTVHFDERGGAFFALGYGRAARKPCVWITTSGTAVANGFPAVVEASMDDVPLICLTADRPVELRDTGANQTINQLHIYGHYPRWFAELHTSDPKQDEPFLRTTIDHAVFRARTGPVHLNCMFQEPLIERYHPRNIHWSPESSPRTHYTTGNINSDVLEYDLLQKIHRAKRGLIVAGRLKNSSEGEAIKRLAAYLGWPLVADICAPIPYFQNLVNFSDLIIRSQYFTEKWKPDVILHFGGALVSKEFQKFLVHSSLRAYALIAPTSDRIDPFHAVTNRVQGEITSVCARLMDSTSATHSDTVWLGAWKQADAAVHAALSSVLPEHLSEPSLVWSLSDILGSNWILGGNSMPIRDLQSFFRRSNDGTLHVFANRGASGIDGILATAAGIACAQSGHGTVLLGDLALLHDVNSLALLRERNVIVVVINNNGGGIFHMLPIPVEQEDFEKVLGTPHGMEFRRAAQQFEIPYSLVTSCTQFKDVWCSAAASSGPHLIEVQTDRNQNAVLHRSLYTLADEAIQKN